MTKKYYKHRQRPEKWEVLFQDHEAVLLQCECNPKSSESGRKQIVYRQYLSEWWEDYKEPVVKKIVRQVVQLTSSSKIFCCDTNETLTSYMRDLGKVEFTTTDGKLTAVKIVD